MAGRKGSRWAGKMEAGLFKLFLWPVCRSYARRLGDQPADGLFRFLCSLQFWRAWRFWPDLVHPRLFSEKLWSRMLHVRDPLLTLICDKLRVRDYVAEKVGPDCLIPLLWSGDDPEDIPFENLPSRFVMKANHGCGYNIIVANKTKLDREDAKRKLRKWLGENFGEDKFLGAGWGYKNIKHCALVEAFIGEDNKPPADFKFYCFSGKAEVLTMHFGRFERHEAKAFDRDFRPLEFSRGFPQYQGLYQKPGNYDAMLHLAESLAAGFDFIRVDLYSAGSKAYFGELTPYPAGVSTFHGLDLKILDNPLGNKWIWHPSK